MNDVDECSERLALSRTGKVSEECDPIDGGDNGRGVFGI